MPWPVTKRLVLCRLPVIAAINGGATARGGADLALACNGRLAPTKAKMGETYVKLGLNPSNGGTYFLPRLVSSGLPADLALTGDLVDAAKARRLRRRGPSPHTRPGSRVSNSRSRTHGAATSIGSGRCAAMSSGAGA